MATQRDVRKIALSLPDTSEAPDHFRFFVKGKQFVWVWLVRLSKIDRDRLREVLTNAWRCRAG